MINYYNCINTEIVLRVYSHEFVKCSSVLGRVFSKYDNSTKTTGS